jgi:hypothetical protein
MIEPVLWPNARPQDVLPWNRQVYWKLCWSILMCLCPKDTPQLIKDVRRELMHTPPGQGGEALSLICFYWQRRRPAHQKMGLKFESRITPQQGKLVTFSPSLSR